MANTFDSNLVNSILAEQAVTVLQSKLPYLKAFTSDFSNEVVAPKSTVNVPVLTGASGVQTDPSNFATGDTDAINAAVALSHYSKSFHITSTQLNQGHRLENLAKINMHVVANKINNVVMSLVTTANYGDTTVTSAPSAVDATVIKRAWAEIAGPVKNIVLADTAYAQFLPSNLESFDPSKTVGVYGYDLFTRAGDISDSDATVGFVCAPEAMAVAAAIPMKPARAAELIDSEVFIVPDLGLPFEINRWVDTNTRAEWASFDIAFGAAVADSSALRIIKG